MSLEAKRSMRTQIAWKVSRLTWMVRCAAEAYLSVTAQCPAENCNGERAYYFQLQIRSADEPMTTFLKVRLNLQTVWMNAD